MRLSSSRHRLTRRGPRLLITLALVLGAAGTQVRPAISAHSLNFELDKDIADSPAGVPFDWENFFSASGAPSPALPDASRPNFLASAFKADFNGDNNAYATGSKDTLPISPGWQCRKANNLGGKFDILNAYAVAYNDSGDLVVYFGSEISSPNGDRNAGFWLLQDPNFGCTQQGGGGTPFTGHHVDGDIFIVAAFTNGGTQGTVDVYQWDGDHPNGPVVKIFSGQECEDPATPQFDDACATVNNSAFVNPPWPSPDKTGGDLDPNEFLEGGVNVTNLLELHDPDAPSPCFATFLANSRSSQELGATLHDFAFDSFPVCANPTGLKYKDVDGDGTQDADNPLEAGIAGFDFELRDLQDNPIASTTSDENGNFGFSDVAFGTYQVCEVHDEGGETVLGPPAGWRLTEPRDTEDDPTPCKQVTIGAGAQDIGKFGNTPLSDVDVTFTPNATLPADPNTFATEATIHCEGPPQGPGGTELPEDESSDPDAELGDGEATLNLNDVVPGIYECTITIIDP